MKIGLMIGTTPTAEIGSELKDVVAFIKKAEGKNFNSVWMANIFSLDAISTLTLAGWETQRIELGTAVTPTYPRHPVAMAQQALTASAAAEGRFSLGIGLSHKMVIENMFGLSYAKPASHMKEYLQVLGPLLRGETVELQGKHYQVNAFLTVPDAPRVPLLVAALGPRMLEIAGTYADGTSTWVTGPLTLEQHIIPSLNRAAAAAGKPTPRVVCGLPIAITSDVDMARKQLAETLGFYGKIPSYRAMLDREGVSGVEHVAIIGDENEARRHIQRLRDIGVTDFNAAIIPVAEGVFDNTLEFLESEL